MTVERGNRQWAPGNWLKAQSPGPKAPPQEHALRAIMLALLVLCFVISPVAIAEKLVPTWNGTALVVFCGLAALESYVSSRVGQRVPGEWRGAAGFRIVEIGMILILLQLYVDSAGGYAPVVGGVPRIDRETIGLFIPVFVTWIAVRSLAEHLANLDQQEDIGLIRTATERVVTWRFLAGGMLLFIAAGLTQPRIARALGFSHASQAGPLINVVFYFLIGAALLGYVHYATLRQRWVRHGVVVAGGLDRWWFRAILGFVALVIVIALLLPTSSTFGLLDSARAAWDEVAGLLRGPLLNLLSLFGTNVHLPVTRVRPPRGIRVPPHIIPVHVQISHHGGSSGPNWTALLQSLFFWSILAAAIVYVVRAYLRARRRRRGLPRQAVRALLDGVGTLWARLRRLLRRSAGLIHIHVPAGLLRRKPRLPTASGLTQSRQWGPRTPRRQVIRYYLSFVRRADREGIGRRPSQTPGELESALAPMMAEAVPDVHSLTESFVEARYSRHEIGEAHASVARTSWQRLRRKLGAIGKR